MCVQQQQNQNSPSYHPPPPYNDRLVTIQIWMWKHDSIEQYLVIIYYQPSWLKENPTPTYLTIRDAHRSTVPILQWKFLIEQGRMKKIFLAHIGFPGGLSRISKGKSTDSGLSALLGWIIEFEGTMITNTLYRATIAKYLIPVLSINYTHSWRMRITN